MGELLETGGLKLVLDACEGHGRAEGTPQAEAEALAADVTELLGSRNLRRV